MGVSRQRRRILSRVLLLAATGVATSFLIGVAGTGTRHPRFSSWPGGNALNGDYLYGWSISSTQSEDTLSWHSCNLTAQTKYAGVLREWAAATPAADLDRDVPRVGRWRDLSGKFPAPEDEYGSESDVGWPFRCAWYASTRPIGCQDFAPVQCITLPYFMNREFTIPLGVIAPGLIADASIYGGLWMLVATLPMAIRRWRRRRRGLCPKCEYDLSGVPGMGCPECGWGRGD